jgi:hypothetical protein
MKMKLLEGKYEGIVRELEEKNKQLQKEVESVVRGNLLRENDSRASDII